jgi:hypothetical protein
MSQPASSDQHVRLLLGTYLLGRLPTDEQRAVEGHLPDCALCWAECDELRKVTALLALLSAQDVRGRLDPVRLAGEVRAGYLLRVAVEARGAVDVPASEARPSQTCWTCSDPTMYICSRRGGCTAAGCGRAAR